MRRYDLSALSWTLKGYSPHAWRSWDTWAYDPTQPPEVGPLPARVPGSVQAALREAGLIPDWNVGMNYRLCQWVEHLDWVFEVRIPDEWLAGNPDTLRACFEGLDYQGELYVNATPVGPFRGTFTPHRFDLRPWANTRDNRLAIVFQRHPDWLGQFGFTSQFVEPKARFYYTWDWVVRLVQIGIWDRATLEASDGPFIERLDLATDAVLPEGMGTLRCGGEVAPGAEGCQVRLALFGPAGVVRQEALSAAAFAQGVKWEGLPVALWWPNGHGDQPLYTLECTLLDSAGRALDAQTRQVGFKHVEWRACLDAPPAADPWLCCVNGKPIFLQGVNWTPVRPNFADVSAEEAEARLALYQRLGLNVLRVWGGAVLEREGFYSACDRLGLMVWQEFPLSSSALDNWPPEDPAFIEQFCATARSYVERRRHHVSLLMWGGGNELQGGLDGSTRGIGKPVDLSHPLMARLGALMAEIDPQHRFVPTSPLGPRFASSEETLGQGLHWDVHGPWQIPGDYEQSWVRFWERDDALFRSETGCPGASPVALMERTRGECSLLPVSADNHFWVRSSWWIEGPQFEREHGRPPDTIEEYVAWSQERQRAALEFAARTTKARFPRIGGLIIWMGHDCYPCAANTSIVDFDGQPKPAALALGEVFNAPQPAAPECR